MKFLFKESRKFLQLELIKNDFDPDHYLYDLFENEEVFFNYKNLCSIIFHRLNQYWPINYYGMKKIKNY